MTEKILIVDDDIETLKMVGLMLQKQGYQIVAAPNGEQGLAKTEAENPDLIILDVMMPGLDGFEVARRLRANPQTATIPIIMFTAKNQPGDKMTGYEAGADDYLTKPVHATELHAHVKALLVRAARSKVGATPLAPDQRAFTIGVLAARGGLGVTSVAVNLGSSLRDVSKEEVIVAEIRPGSGTLGPDLGENDPRALTTLLETDLADINRQKVGEALFQHSKGLSLLFGSIHPEDGIFLNSTIPFETLVNRLTYLARYLVLDLGPGLPPVSQKLITSCNQALVVVEPVANSVKHTKALLSALADLGFDQRTTQVLVVNRIRSETLLNWHQVEDQLGRTPVGSITPAPELFSQAVHMKTTVTACQPDSQTAEQFERLATAMLEVEKQKS